MSIGRMKRVLQCDVLLISKACSNCTCWGAASITETSWNRTGSGHTTCQGWSAWCMGPRRLLEDFLWRKLVVSLRSPPPFQGGGRGKMAELRLTKTWWCFFEGKLVKLLRYFHWLDTVDMLNQWLDPKPIAQDALDLWRPNLIYKNKFDCRIRIGFNLTRLEEMQQMQQVTPSISD